jgi:hypothetical protein
MKEGLEAWDLGEHHFVFPTPVSPSDGGYGLNILGQMKLHKKIAVSYSGNQQSVGVTRMQLTRVEPPSDKHPGFPRREPGTPHRKEKS